MIKYSVIICTYNRCLLLKETIAALIGLIAERNDVEVVIVDNNCTDDTAVVVKGFKEDKIKYLFEEKQGLSNARNRGLIASRGEILIFFDDDIDIEANYFAVCDKLFSDPTIEIAGGKVLPHKIEIPAWLPPEYYYLVSIFDLGNKAKKVSKLMGANYAMRKSVANKVGWYNIKLGRNGMSLGGNEEVDYLNRAIANGFAINYSPELIVYHKINEKINTSYVYNYAFSLGKAEALTDRANSKLKYAGKQIKSVIANILYALIGFYIPNGKKKTFFKIIQRYGAGYLKKE